MTPRPTTENNMPDTPAPAPEAMTADLTAMLLRAITDPGDVVGVKFSDDRVIDWQVLAVRTVLREGGWIMDGVPPVRQVLADARQYSDELVLTKLVARFFRLMVLGAVIIPETPAAMDWLRDYIDGTHRVHGPLGKPMIWPGRLPAIEQLLRGWGFQPTPTTPQYVSLKPGGVMAPLDLPDPQAPDPRSVVPIAEQRERNMGALLDSTAGGVNIMAVDRMTAIRAMSVAFDRGATHFDATPVIASLHQLRDHQQQASEDGSMVTVSRQALDEVLNHLATDEGEG